MAAEKLPERFGRYEVLRAIGAGGMGIVMAARDPQLGRTVAIKAMPKRLRNAPTIAERFLREALTLARLSHPNIVLVFDSGDEDGILYYVMELLQGTPLDKRVPRDADPASRVAPPFDLKEYLDTFKPLADALATVHGAGIIHRDIKPANIIANVPERGPVLTDFGLTWVESDEKLTQEGMVMGTAHFMAPEQVMGYAPDALCDIYAFGASMFEYVTGRIPFEQIPHSNLLTARMVAELPSVRKLAPDVPEQVASIIDNCVKVKPKDRFQSARDLYRALSRVGRVQSSQASANAAPRVSTGSMKLIPGTPAAVTPEASWHAQALAVLLLASAAGVGFGLWRTRSVDRPAPPAIAAASEVRPAVAPKTPPPPPAAVDAATQTLVRSWDKPLQLTGPGESGKRAALGVSGDGTLLVAWVTENGEVAVRLGREHGRYWSTPAGNRKLHANPQSELAMVGLLDSFFMLYTATIPAGRISVQASSTSSSGAAWSAPSALGRADGPAVRLALLAAPVRSKSEPLLAIWDGPGGAAPSAAWGSGTAGTWYPASTPPSKTTTAPGRPTGALTVGQGAVLIWQEGDPEHDGQVLLVSRSDGPGLPWSAPAHLSIESAGYDRLAPVASSTGDRIYLQWMEDQMPAHPLVVGASDDAGHTFKKVGSKLYWFCKDSRTALAASGDSIWSVWYIGVQNRLVWSGSVDAGRSWTKPATLEDEDKSSAQPAVAAVSSREAWVVWADPTEKVRLMKLP